MSNLVANLPTLVRYVAIVGLLERAFEVSIRELVEARFTSCDLTIRPELDASPMDWDPARFAALADAGERAAEPAVKELLDRRRALLSRWSSV